MAFYSWLIPLFVIFVLILAGFYLAVKLTGGTGVRTDGRTVVDKPIDDEDHSS